MSARRSASERTRPLVLFIEDNLMQRDLYEIVLSREVDVITASRGEEGYELAVRERPDAIVVDVLLPDVDGLTVCQRLRANPMTESIPLVVLTGDDEAYARAAQARSELTGVLLKPCSGDHLLTALRQAVERTA